jgi:hypothetical protein
MIALDEQDFEILTVAVDLMGKHIDNELAEARRRGNNAKQMAMITMRTRIAVVRVKLATRELP